MGYNRISLSVEGRQLDLFAYVLLILNVMVENMGIPLPTEASYVLAAVQVKQGHSFVLMATLLTFGHLAGSSLAFVIGWWGEGWLATRFKHSQRFAEASQAIHRWYERYGNITVFALRFVGYLRPWSSLVAGFAKLDWRPFIVLTLVGSILFNILVLKFTVYAVDWWNRFGLVFKIGSIILFILSFSVIFVLNHYWKRRHKSLDGGLSN
ncbi:MAG: VTT domain-containing protein [Syntrophomonadaceae bacterium]